MKNKGSRKYSISKIKYWRCTLWWIISWACVSVRCVDQCGVGWMRLEAWNLRMRVGLQSKCSVCLVFAQFGRYLKFLTLWLSYTGMKFRRQHKRHVLDPLLSSPTHITMYHMYLIQKNNTTFIKKIKNTTTTTNNSSSPKVELNNSLQIFLFFSVGYFILN